MFEKFVVEPILHGAHISQNIRAVSPNNSVTSSQEC